MPKSRGRRPSQRSVAARRRARRRRYDEAKAARRGPVAAITSKLSPEGRANMRATADAELRGDPVDALRHYAAIAQFEGSLHHGRLTQLVELGDEAPGWLWSRWLTVQARRPLWTGSGSDQPEPALQTTLETAYPHGIDASYLEDASLEFFLATMHERDWLLRQLIVYERGGLRHLVENLAAPRLLDRADRVREWPAAPMGGYRLDSDEHHRLQLTDLGAGRQVEVLDLGLASEHWPGTHFLGRLAPITEPPHRMFEWRPLPIDQDTAQAVADRPAEWLSTVARRARAGLLPPMFSYQEDDCSMTSDLPSRSWLGLLSPDEVSGLPAPYGLIDYDDVALFVLGKLLRTAPHVAPALSPARHFVEELMLEPGLQDRIREEFGGRAFVAGWRVLAALVRDPARGRCQRLAGATARAAAGSASA